MIIFQNPGQIDINAFRLMGASVKEEGSFGRFGTGLKYAVATILRGGGEISLFTDAGHWVFKCDEVVFRDKLFREVVMIDGSDDDRTELGFTDALGRDWEPWMAARELGCNARDEGGDFTIWDDNNWAPCGDPDVTEIVVTWPEMEEALRSDEAHVFAPDVPDLLGGEGGVRVLPGPSKYLYHRGVRVWELPKPSVFTYDVLDDVDLTEDRTVKYSFCVVAQVRNMILATDDRGIIAAAVTAKNGTWESDFDWTGAQWEPRDPGPDWLEEVATIREKDQGVSKSAANVLLSHSAMQKTTSFYGGSYEEPTGDYADVVADLESILGREAGKELEDMRVFAVDEIPSGGRSSVRNGSVYLTRTTIEDNPYTLANELLRRFFEIKTGGNFEALLDLVVPMLLDTDYDMKRHKSRIEGIGVPEVAEAVLT